ncbi:MAG: ABC transporter substrate-binding protein [bacterium]
MKRFQTLIAFSAFFLSAATFAGPSAKDTTLSRPNAGPAAVPEKSNGVIVRQQADAAPGTPSRAIQDLEAKMDDYRTGDNLTSEDKAKNAQIKKEIITGIFDIRELCRLSLDKHWGQRSAAEQSNFVNLMSQLLEKKAILSKEQSKTQGKKVMIKYLGDSFLDPQKTRARTKTSITIPKEEVNISIEYKLVKNGNEWKIFDVIVDDASLVDNYKYQFNSIITKHGYPELVSRISKKLNDLDSKS